MPTDKNDIQDTSINDPQKSISVKITFYFNILKQSILDFFWELPLRNELGASSQLFQELAAEDPKEYFLAFKMSEESFNKLLNKIKVVIAKRDSLMRDSIPANTKLQAVLYFLVTEKSSFLENFFLPDYVVEEW